MNGKAPVNRRFSGFARLYGVALRRWLARDRGASLEPAVRLGRQAVVLGMETLDLALAHERALGVLALTVVASAARDRLFRRAGEFFAEAVLPMEETHRTALEANRNLLRLNQALNQRTLDLVASNRRMRREIGRRQAVEAALRNSERHTTRLLARSRQVQDDLRLLSRGILSVQEEERKRISRELHDVIAQMLTGISVRLTNLKSDATASSEGITRKIGHTQRLIEKSVDIVHRFARELRPSVLDHLGLIPALRSFMDSFAKQTGIRVRLTLFAGLEELSIAKRTALYRVVQEAMSNVSRHAKARRVEVSIAKGPNAVVMQIKDDGKLHRPPGGRATKSQQLGLLGMRERIEMIGGKFEIEFAPGRGTTIRARVPFHAGRKEGTGP